MAASQNKLSLGRLELEDIRLFLWKVLFVFALTYALLPLIWYKRRLPAMVYAGGLIVIHVVVLLVYCYKVSFRKLDPSCKSAAARASGLVTCILLLLVVSKWADSNVVSIPVFAAQLLVLCLVHTIILAFLMVKWVGTEQESPSIAQSAEDVTEALLSSNQQTVC